MKLRITTWFIVPFHPGHKNYSQSTGINSVPRNAFNNVLAQN